MTLSELTLEIEKLTKEKQKLFDTIKPLQNKFNSICDKLANLIEDKNKLELAEKHSDNFDFNMLMDGLHGNSLVILREQEKQLRKLSLYTKGYRPDNLQTAISIKLYRGNSKHTQKVLEGLITILPYIKELKCCDGKPIDVFEHTLSEFGGWDLVIKTDNTVSLLHGGLSINRVEKTFLNIEEALKYCENHHYYEIYNPNKENTCIY